MKLNRYVDQTIQIHTLRIELIDEKILLYKISPQVKDELEKCLFNRADDMMEGNNMFVSFHTEADRFVFVKISCIKKIIFCWDIISAGQEYLIYQDNFDVVINDEEDPIISELIIKIRNSNEPAVFDNLDPDADLLGIDENSFKNIHFLKGGFLTVKDEDGDQTFVPIVNIECIEVNRVFVYPDDIWQEMSTYFDTKKLD